MKPRPHRSAMRWMRSRSNDLSPTLSAEQPMSIQRVSLGDFWDRYGREDFEETDFAQALGRLTTISQAGPLLQDGMVQRRSMLLPRETGSDFFFKDKVQ